MTLICAAISDGQYAIGSDSGAFETDSTLVMRSALPKIFRRGDWLLGSAGSFRVIDLLADFSGNGPFELRSYLSAHNPPTDWSILMANHSDIYEVTGDLAVVKYREKYAAIGAADQIATGALAALAGCDLGAKEMVTVTLTLSVRHSTGCVGPLKTLVATRHD